MIRRRDYFKSGLLLLGVALVWAAGGATSAEPQQAPAGSFVESVDVERINVEVRVQDRQGLAVTGLTAADFRVFHDGQEVSVTNFTEFRDGLAVEPGEKEPSADARTVDHHLVVYFDELHLQANHRAELIDAFEEFLTTDKIPPENIMILRQVGELNIVASFGSTRDSLEQALNGLRQSAPGLSPEVATRQALDDIQRTWNQSRDNMGSGEQGIAQIPGASLGGGIGSPGGSPRDVTGSSGSLSAGNVPSSCQIFDSRVEAILNGWMQERAGKISVTLAGLGDSATYLAGLPGIKSLLYLSDALETMPGQALSNYADTICPGGDQNLLMNTLGEELGSAFIALTRHAAANRVTIYSLQGGGLQVSSAGSARDRGVRAGRVASFEASRRAGDQSGLILLAEETGGSAAMNRNDYGAALSELGDEILNFYSLAFEPAASGPGSEHEIEVRVQDSSLTARFRRGYTGKSPDQKLTESLQGALVLGLVDNPLQARLAADAFRAGAEGTTIMPLRVVLPVELVSFLPAGEELMASILVRILVRDLDTGETRSVDRPFKVKHQPGSGGEWMQLPVDLQLSPGSHLVAVGVLDQESNVTSLVSTTVQVPAT